MKKWILLISIVLLSIVQPAFASLLTSSTYVGNYGVEVAAFPTAYSSGSGSLNLSTIPSGSTIVSATLYGNNYFSSPSASAIFNGTSLGAVTSYSSDGGFYAYKWDVTSLITGNGAYPASYSGLDNTYGLALSVVYSAASLPVSSIYINQGALDIVGPETASTQFTTASAGTGTLYIHTLADDAFSSNETINFNGASVGGPIDANLGDYASLFNLPVSAVLGLNTVSIYSQGDQFGWDLAVLKVGGGEQSVPEPSTILLISAGLLGLAGYGRRKI